MAVNNRFPTTLVHWTETLQKSKPVMVTAPVMILQLAALFSKPRLEMVPPAHVVVVVGIGVVVVGVDVVVVAVVGVVVVSIRVVVVLDAEHDTSVVGALVPGQRPADIPNR